MLVIETLLNSLPRQLVQLRCKLSAVILASTQSLLTIIVGSSLVRETILSDSLIQKFFVLTMSSIAVEPSLTQSIQLILMVNRTIKLFTDNLVI